MKIYRGAHPRNLNYPVVALGNFDGVHIGHQMIFRRVAEIAKAQRGTGVVYTFQPHPLKVIAPDNAPPLLTTFRSKMELVDQCGIDVVILGRFNRRFADQRPRDFAQDILVKGIGVSEVVVGFDYAFGKGREGTIPYLTKMGEEFGFQVHVVEQVKIAGHGVSSSHVRDLLEDGKVEDAAVFLGRPYSINGPVVHGFKTGRGIGFPTANLDTSKVQIPGTGVYAVRIGIGGNTYGGVVNIGFNPTFNRDRLSVEAHIFDFNHSIYGSHIEITFLKRIRGEQAFDSADALVKQIEQDIETAKQILKENGL